MSRTQKIIIGVVVAVLLGLFVIGALVGVAVSGWKSAVRSGNEAAALQNLKTIAAVEVQYFNSHNRTFGTFEQLAKEQMSDRRFSANPPNVDGYVFILKVIPKTTSQPSSYTLNADPESDRTGNNHFYLDSTEGSIRVNADQPAGASDPPLNK